MIKEFFTGKNILITGVTGFLGKVLVERVLWEAPDVNKIRLLARPAAGKGAKNKLAAQRVGESLTRSPAFARLRARHPDFQGFLDEKLEVFACDLFEEDLGLSKKDQAAAFKDLDAVIHIAACVSWDERFDYSIRVNTLAAGKLMELAAGTDPHPRFIHISSAFVHGQRNGEVFEENFNPEFTIANEMGSDVRFDLKDEINAALAKADEETAKADSPSLAVKFRKEAEELGEIPKYAALSMEKRIERQRKWHIRTQLSSYGRERARLHGWIDSYTFSKAMAEMVLTKSCGKVPLSIVRPPGITSAVTDPVKGWLEGYHLVEPLIEGVGRGMIKSFPGDPKTVIDTVPVDYVVNLIMAACANPAQPEAPRVYQVGTSHLKPISLQRISEIWLEYFKENPFRNSKGKPVKPVPPRFYASPAEFVEFYQKKRKLPLSTAGIVLKSVPVARSLPPVKKAAKWIDKTVKQIDRLCQFSDLYSAYTVNSWVFVTNNTMDLLRSLPEEDQKRFCFDSSSIDWEAYWTKTHIPGMRRYVIHEK